MKSVLLCAALSFVVWTAPVRAEERCTGSTCVGHRDHDDGWERREHRDRDEDLEERREHRETMTKVWSRREHRDEGREEPAQEERFERGLKSRSPP